jgi:dTDP-4-dehydrorhamnose reductase
MKTLITGANGMLARAAADYCNHIGDDIVALSRQDLDLDDIDAVSSKFAEQGPEIILNCAAYTNVDGAESNVDLAYQANSIGPENLAIVCREFGSKLVTVSTDYVFDGEKGEPYVDLDEPRPLGIYAESKYDGEKRVSAANSAAVIVRSGWIYGNGGTNFLSVMPRLLADGKQIRVISDNLGTPTSAKDLAHRMREVAGTKIKGIIHITNAGEGTSNLGYAQKVCEIGGFDADLVRGVPSVELQRPAPRPMDSRLRSSDLTEYGLEPLQSWETALRQFVLA